MQHFYEKHECKTTKRLFIILALRLLQSRSAIEWGQGMPCPHSMIYAV